MNNDHPDKRTNEDQLTMGIIISTSAFVLITVVVVVVCLVCSKKKNQKKKEQEAQADVNPVYDGGLDYEYDDMGNYDSMEVSIRKKREVKAELVDRCSIYGEKEEGWEDAVAIDENPNYES